MRAKSFDVLLVSLICLLSAQAAETNRAGESASLQLSIDLVDGSRILGTPAIESVPMETSYAKMNVPLKQIQTMKIGEDHETVTLELRNGDKLKGVITLAPVKLTTVFGQVSVNLALATGISVYPTSQEALPAAIQDGLVLYCAFDKDEGEKVTDASGKRNDGSTREVTWTPNGKVGGACSFDGNNSHIEVADTKELRTVKSISAWVKSRANGVRQVIVSKHSSVNNGYASAGYYLMKEQNNKFSIAFCIDGNAGAASDSLTTYKDNQWHHVVGVLHTETGRADLYVDGKNVADYNSVNRGPAVGTSQLPLYIGRATWGYGCTTSASWNGQIDEVRVYDRELSETEVRFMCDNR
ncbi:MAG: LamG domain-containing protein [Kiritimatiellia bacterium]